MKVASRPEFDIQAAAFGLAGVFGQFPETNRAEGVLGNELLQKPKHKRPYLSSLGFGSIRHQPQQFCSATHRSQRPHAPHPPPHSGVKKKRKRKRVGSERSTSHLRVCKAKSTQRRYVTQQQHST